MRDQQYIRISYGRGIGPELHDTYITVMPLEDCEFPRAFNNAVDRAASEIKRSLARDLWREEES